MRSTKTLSRHARHEPDHSAFFVSLAASLGFVSYLANQDGFPVYSLGWTLEYEMFFYVCFSAALAMPRHLAVFALAAALAILALAGQILQMLYWASYLASSQILEFAAGMMAAEGGRVGRCSPRVSVSKRTLART